MPRPAHPGGPHPIAALARGPLACMLGAIMAAAEPAPSADGLAPLRDLRIDHGTIELAERLAATTAPDHATGLPDLPARTVVKIRLHPASGSNILVEVWLPEAGRWNGRFIGLGNGGSAGHINPGTLAWPLRGGNAVATTDMGTSPNADSGIGNREVWKDFGFRATHLMTIVAKQVVAAHYGKAPTFSYFSGGSTGGQQALQEAQRYPDDYDGIVANVPAHCRTPLHAYFLWNEQILHRCPFTPAQQHAVVQAGIEYMAAHELPQTAGRMVSDPRHGPADVEAVIALARTKDPSLSDTHAEALRKLFDGPRHAVTGERIHDGIPFGGTFDIAHGNLYLFKWVFGASKDLMQVDFGADIDAYTAALGPFLNAENPDLDRFAQRGGKLIMTPGSADSCVPYHASIDYVERVAERCGSIERTAAFLKLYIIPGMSHGPGPGINTLPDMLGLVIAWREKGIDPGALACKRIVEGKVELELPVYPYPAKTGWTADGGFAPVPGPRGGVGRIAARFLPPAAE